MAKSKIDLSVVILNYNTQALLKDCLESIEKSQLKKYQIEIIVVDNASTDQSVTMVKKEFKKVKLIQSQKNVGFSAGNNLAVSEISGRLVLFLNPDTKVMADTFVTMIEYLDQNPQAGIVTCRVELPDGRLDYPCHRGFPTPLNAFIYFSGLVKLFPQNKFFGGYTLSYLSLDQVHEIDACSGAFLLIRKDLGQKLDWWDEDYFWYGDDLDFCYRVKKNGFKVMFVPKTKIIHYRGAASGIIKHSQKVTTADKRTKINSMKASTQAMLIFYQKHYRRKYSTLVFWLVLKGIKLLEIFRLLKVKLR